MSDLYEVCHYIIYFPRMLDAVLGGTYRAGSSKRGAQASRAVLDANNGSAGSLFVVTPLCVIGPLRSHQHQTQPRRSSTRTEA
jgi:hypothetical protein